VPTSNLFTLNNSGANALLQKVPYTVHWNDGGGVDTTGGKGTALTPIYDPIAFSHASKVSMDCKTEPNAQINIGLSEAALAELSSSAGGALTGVLTVLVPLTKS
jgi:hypothetical protein